MRWATCITRHVSRPKLMRVKEPRKLTSKQRGKTRIGRYSIWRALAGTGIGTEASGLHRRGIEGRRWERVERKVRYGIGQSGDSWKAEAPNVTDLTVV